MNKHTQHTPGPWTVYTKVNSRRKTADVLVRDSDQNDIAQVFGETRGEAETDARLIAAAPEMLDALRLALTCLDAAADGRLEDVKDEIGGTANIVDEVITKAQGGAE